MPDPYGAAKKYLARLEMETHERAANHEANEDARPKVGESVQNVVANPMLCWNCGQTWSEFTNGQGETYWVCWACAKTV